MFLRRVLGVFILFSASSLPGIAALVLALTGPAVTGATDEFRVWMADALRHEARWTVAKAAPLQLEHRVIQVKFHQEG